MTNRPPIDYAKITREFDEMRPAGGFHVLLADFPWEWQAYSEAGLGKSPNRHYDGTMTVDEIKALPIGRLAAKDCALFTWNIWPLSKHWHAVIEAHGFEFAGLAWEWIKYNPETGKYAFGGGYGTRKNLEPCLLATKGNPKLRRDLGGKLFGATVIPEGVHSVRDFIEAMPLDCLRAPRREHSRKPDEQYTRIETMFDGRMAEIFATQRRAGWTSWGNQIGKHEAPA